MSPQAVVAGHAAPVAFIMALHVALVVWINRGHPLTDPDKRRLRLVNRACLLWHGGAVSGYLLGSEFLPAGSRWVGGLLGGTWLPPCSPSPTPAPASGLPDEGPGASSPRAAGEGLRRETAVAGEPSRLGPFRITLVLFGVPGMVLGFAAGQLKKHTSLPLAARIALAAGACIASIPLWWGVLKWWFSEKAPPDSGG